MRLHEGAVHIGAGGGVEQRMNHAAHRRAARCRCEAATQRCDALAALYEQRGERERQHRRAVFFCAGGEVGDIVHRGRTVAPYPDAFGRLALGLAHEEMRRAGGVAPVDGGRRIALPESAELPEGFALCDGRGDMFGLGDEGRHDLRQRFGLFAQAGCAGRGCR